MTYSLVRIKRRWVPEPTWRFVCRVHRTVAELSPAVAKAWLRTICYALTRELCAFERFKFGREG